MRTYKRKTTRQEWDAGQMRSAIEAVNRGEMGLRKASKNYSVPKSTLEDRLKKLKSGSTTLEGSTVKGLGNFKKTFTDAQESELVDYIKLMESRLFGLTTKDLRRLAFELAERNGIKHSFKNNIAGLDWLKGFLKRHHDLSLRSPEPTSAARAMGFNKTAVAKFFTILLTCIDKYKIQPHRLYNVDETAITTVPKSQSRIIAQRGRRQVGTLTSAERGQIVTAELCFSASGHYIPPLLVFSRVRMKAELLDGAPLGTVAACHKSGWMQSDIFLQWMKHFSSHVKPSLEDRVLLLLDGHATHTKNIDVINYARANGIVMLCFPPHCTHRLQPLDVSFMAPLSAYYSQEQKTWLRNNPGRVVTQYQICKLFGKAYEKAATIQTAAAGFRKTGISPTDPNIFAEADFAAAETTEREYTKNNETEKDQPEDEQTMRPLTPQPGPSGLIKSVVNTIDKYENNSSGEFNSSFSKSPRELLPVPQANRSLKYSRKRGKTAILTESPYKNELEEALGNQKQNKKEPVKRSLGGKVHQKKKRKQKKDIAYLNGVVNSEDELCIYCEEAYSETQKDDGWVQCTACTKWAHEGCTGISEDNLNVFKCNKCVSS